MRTLKTLMLCVLIAGSAQAAERPLRIVATLSTFADLVKTVGGEHVDVASIASPRFNPHFIEPKPSDVLKVKRADLFIHAGLDLELWRWPLVDAAGNREVMSGGPRELDLSRGIALLEVPDRAVTRAEGDIHLYGNPHYWLDPGNVKVMARAIADKLAVLDPTHTPEYQQNLQTFLARLEAHISEWQQLTSALHGKEVIAYHRSWPYLLRFAGVVNAQFLEPKPGIPPTPRQLSALESYIAEHRTPAIIQETFVPRGPSQALARRTGIRVVTLCQNVGERPECSDYIAMLDYDIRQLVEALAP